MACAWIAEAQGDSEPALPAALAESVQERDWRNCCRVLANPEASPLTTSVGRLFDAVGVLCGAPAQVTYEGQAAVELEAMTDSAEGSGYEMPLAAREADGKPGATIDARAAVAELVGELERGVSPALVATRFHNGLSIATAAACAVAASDAGVGTAVLSGGVFQNRVLLESTSRLLAEAGLRVLVPERLPPNDGGISYGQLAVAAAQCS
jgi:hydrogenase maturation protein HypF